MTVTMAGERAVSKRLYVGNLFPDVTDEDLKSKFNRCDLLTWYTWGMILGEPGRLLVRMSFSRCGTSPRT
jgi:RNA recognition motif-containing protein